VRYAVVLHFGNPCVASGPAASWNPNQARDALLLPDPGAMDALIRDARSMGHHRSPMSYHANVGPAQGPLLHRDAPGVIGVLEALDKPMPIGMALCVGWGPGRVAMWKLSVHGVDVPDLWVVIDREFVPAHRG
jgi:hypothetical protein